MRHAIVGGIVIVAACASGASAGQLPASWKGEVDVESEIPTVSISGAVVMVKTGGVVPIDANNGTIQGKATIPYVNDMDAPNCTARVRGQFETTIDGTYTVPADDSPGNGGVLDLQFTRALTNATNTISCPPRPPIVMPMTIPAQGGKKMTLPFKHKAGATQEVSLPGGAVLHNSLSVSLPCDWADGPPGPTLVFNPDPREPTFASGIPDETLHIKQLTGLANMLSNEEGTPESVNLGLTTFSFNFMPHVHTSSAPARHMEGKSCVWVDSIEFTVSPIQVYGAYELSQGSAMCRELVLAHEDTHFHDVQSLLKGYAIEIVQQLRSVPGKSLPRLYDDPTDGEARLALEATNKISALEEQYRMRAKEAGSIVDNGPTKATIDNECGPLVR